MNRHRALFFVLILLGFIAHPIYSAPDGETSSRGEAEIIRTFYLENADLKDMMTLLRSMIGAKNIAADEGLHAIVLRDSKSNIARAEQLIQDHDLPRNEVVVDVKLIEVDVETLHRLVGVELAEGIPVRLSPEDLARLETNAAARLLVHPKLSLVAERSAEFHAGDRVPVPISNEGAISYQDVGFKLILESRVHPGAGEVTLDFRMEVSRSTSREAGRPVFETKSIISSVRLGNGETYFLTGLNHGGAGALATEPEAEREELVLALTPHVTRRVEVGERPVDLSPAP